MLRQFCRVRLPTTPTRSASKEVNLLPRLRFGLVGNAPLLAVSDLFRCLAVLMVACGALCWPAAAKAQNAQSDGDPAGGDSKPASKPPRTRQKVTLKLPEEYRSKDKDKDGQIGMYEWPRTDYATFRRLDLNGDGFITPLELSRAGRSKRSAATEVSSVSSTGSGGSGSSSRSTESGSTTATALPAAAADTPADGTSDAPIVSRSEAERQFEVVDKDKDGKVTEAELQKSIVARLKFTKAGIVLSFPVSRDEFLRVYPAAK